MNAQAKNLQTLYAKTRLLLALWDLGANEQMRKTIDMI
jgi:hypothetical protein